MNLKVGSRVLMSVVLIVAVQGAIDDHRWDYGGQHGPESWPGFCTKGSRQSPINVKVSSKATVAPFHFSNYDRSPRSCHVKNNGHSIVVSMEPADLVRAPRVQGGGLPGVFRFAQLHFHWAKSDELGSEHTLDDCDKMSEECERVRSFPMEMHLVHFNVKYGDSLGQALRNASGADDTLAVLGVFFNVDNAQHSYLNPIVDALEELKNADAETSCKLFPPMDMVPLNTTHFYRYQGSLTTPNCDEIVVWTLFANPVTLTSRQLELFRSVSSGRTAMENNFRPTQPINGRQVIEMMATDTSLGHKLVVPHLAIVTGLISVFMRG